jgi:hypothetical protein
VDSHAHTSDFFSVDANNKTTLPLIVGGYADLSAIAALQTTITISPLSGETVEITKSGSIEVGAGMLLLQIANDPFTRGGTGNASFTLQNTGETQGDTGTLRTQGRSLLINFSLANYHNTDTGTFFTY